MTAPHRALVPALALLQSACLHLSYVDSEHVSGPLVVNDPGKVAVIARVGGHVQTVASPVKTGDAKSASPSAVSVVISVPDLRGTFERDASRVPSLRLFERDQQRDEWKLAAPVPAGGFEITVPAGVLHGGAVAVGAATCPVPWVLSPDALTLNPERSKAELEHRDRMQRLFESYKGHDIGPEELRLMAGTEDGIHEERMTEWARHSIENIVTVCRAGTALDDSARAKRLVTVQADLKLPSDITLWLTTPSSNVVRLSDSWTSVRDTSIAPGIAWAQQGFFVEEKDAKGLPLDPFRTVHANTVETGLAWMIPGAVLAAAGAVVLPTLKASPDASLRPLGPVIGGVLMGPGLAILVLGILEMALPETIHHQAEALDSSEPYFRHGYAQTAGSALAPAQGDCMTSPVAGQDLEHCFVSKGAIDIAAHCRSVLRNPGGSDFHNIYACVAVYGGALSVVKPEEGAKMVPKLCGYPIVGVPGSPSAADRIARAATNACMASASNPSGLEQTATSYAGLCAADPSLVQQEATRLCGSGASFADTLGGVIPHDPAAE